MSVAELIARLQEMPPRVQVYLRDLFSYEELSEDDIIQYLLNLIIRLTCSLG